MLKIEKEVTITITGDDVRILSEVCELARREICKHRSPVDTSYAKEEYKFIFEIFDES